MFYQPGLLIGGNVEHDCNPQRSIGYYLEALVCLAPFTKSPIRAVLRGVTSDQTDPSVSTFVYHVSVCKWLHISQCCKWLHISVL